MLTLNKLTISYLMQTLIALVAFVTLLTIHLRKLRPSQQQEDRRHGKTISIESLSRIKPPVAERTHTSLWLHLTSEFHKLQCYYSIVLQIASLTALYGNDTPARNTYDETFLLLISANGLVPVSLTCYALTWFDYLDSYSVILTVLSALLASITGFHIVVTFPAVDGKVMVGGTWPATCGGLSPTGICGMNDTLGYHLWPNHFFIAGGMACDVIILSLTLRYLTSYISFHGRRSRHREQRLVGEGPASKRGVARWIGIITRTTTITTLIFLTAIEFFFFKLLLIDHNNILDNNNWSFGQIVGIATWSAVIVDLIWHEIGVLLSQPPVLQPFLHPLERI